MPRIKKSLVETTDLPIVETDNEEGSLPFFLIEDDYGIACDVNSYSLVQRKRSNKTVKDENGKEDHVEVYWKWDAFRWTNTMPSILHCYVKCKEKELNRKLSKEKDFKKVLANYQEIYNIIEKALSVEGENKRLLSASSIIDQTSELDAEIKTLRDRRLKLEKECNELEKLIKEKRKIIVGEHKVKK